jgi:NitT/TauT family transport system substrate-binding protein
MQQIYSRFVLGLLVSSLILTACTPAASTPVAPKPTLTPIKLKAGVPPNLSNAAFFIAQDEGYFAEQGVEVEFVAVASGVRSIPALISGDIDILAGSVSVAAFSAIAKGEHLRVVADKGHYEPGKCSAQGFVVRPEFLKSHSLTGPADFKGLKVNTNMTGYNGYQLEKYIARAGLTPADLTISNLDATAELAAVEQGTIDTASMQDPQLTQEVLAGRLVVALSGDKTTAGKQVAYVLYGASLVDKNPEAGKRFMAAYLKAVKQYNQGATDRNVAIVAKYSKIDAATLKQACWQYIAEDGQIDPQSIAGFEEWAVQKKLLDVAVPVDQFWDHSFIDYANQVLSGK